MMTFMQRGALVLVAVMLLLGQKSAFAQTLACSSSCTPGPTDTCVDVSGVVTYEASTVSALVLINGVSQFSKESDGKYGCKVLVKSDGVITVKAFAGGFAPYTQEITQSQADGFAINILALNTLDAVMNVTVNVQPSDGNPGAYDLSGNVKSFGQPVNAYMIGSGVESFSTPASGDFTLQGLFPDSDGQIELFAFADGHQSYSRFITLGCAAGNTCDFDVQLSNQLNKEPNTGSWNMQEFAYAHGLDAPQQIRSLDTTWTSSSADGKEGVLFNYLQTTNFTNYNPTLQATTAPTALYVYDKKQISSGMTLQYGNQTLAGTPSGDGYYFFDLSDPNAITLISQNPYQFTIHSVDNNGSDRELAVWLSSEYTTPSVSYQSVQDLYNNGVRNHWMVAGDGYIAYVGGLFDYARNNPNGFNLNLDMDLNGKEMNLSTNYALFYVSNGVPADCVSDLNAPGATGCTLEFKGQYTTPVTGKIIIAGAGRINGYELLKEGYPGKYTNKPLESPDNTAQKAEYRVQSGLIELSSSYNDGNNGPAIDIAGITVGFSPKREDSSVLLNNRYLSMLSLADAITANGSGLSFTQKLANNHPVQVFDFKMVGNWVDAADGLEVHGRNSYLAYTYLHIADDSMKVAANALRYEQTTVLQGDVQTGGLINIGSYGFGRPITTGANVDGVYAHRITHKRGVCGTVDDNKLVGFCGAALVASPNCNTGTDITNVVVTNLRVNNLGGDISSVNKPFNIGLGKTFGDSCEFPGEPTNVEKLLFTDFQIFIDPESDSSIFDRGAGGGALEPIGFYDGTTSTNPVGKVTIYPGGDDTFGYFICGTDKEAQCWNTNGEGQNTKTNVEYSPGTFGGINFPYGKAN
jgi:hypothetical protein